MGQQRQADQAGRPAGSACVWAVAAVLLLAVLAGGGFLVLYLALPPAEVPHWLPIAGLALVALPWAFWIATCAYRCCCCCCSSSSPEQANAAAAAGHVERQPSSTRPAAVAPLPSSTNLKSAVRSPMGSHSGTRRVHFGDSTVLGEKGAGAAGAGEAAVEEEEEEEKDECSSVTSHESEAPLAQSMHSS